MRDILFFFCLISFSTNSFAQIKSPEHKPAVVFLSTRFGYGYSIKAKNPSGIFSNMDAGFISKRKIGMVTSMQYQLGKLMSGPDYRTIKKSTSTQLGLVKTFVINRRSVIDLFGEFGVGNYILEKSIFANSKILKSEHTYYLISSAAVQYATGIRHLELSAGLKYNLPLEKTEPEISFLLFYIGIGYRGTGKK